MPSRLDEFMLSVKYAIRKLAGSQIQWYGLDTSSLIIEHVPLTIGSRPGAQDIPVRIEKAAAAGERGM